MALVTKKQEGAKSPSDSEIYAEYNKGVNCDSIAEKYGLDSKEVFAIISTTKPSKTEG